MGFVQPKVKGYKSLLLLVFFGSLGGPKWAPGRARKMSPLAGPPGPRRGPAGRLSGTVRAGAVRLEQELARRLVGRDRLRQRVQHGRPEFDPLEVLAEIFRRPRELAPDALAHELVRRHGSLLLTTRAAPHRTLTTSTSPAFRLGSAAQGSQSHPAEPPRPPSVNPTDGG